MQSQTDYNNQIIKVAKYGRNIFNLNYPSYKLIVAHIIVLICARSIQNY